MVLVAATVEDGGVDAGRLGALREELATLGGLLERLETAKVGFRPVDGRQGATRRVVDELGGDPAVGAKDRDARTLWPGVIFRQPVPKSLLT